jgi:hypothetical protein
LQVDQQRGMPDKKNKRGGARARARDGGRTTAQRKHNTHDSTHLPTCLFIFVSVFASRRVSQVGNEKLFATMMPPPLRRNRILEGQMPTVSPNEPWPLVPIVCGFRLECLRACSTKRASGAFSPGWPMATEIHVRYPPPLTDKARHPITFPCFGGIYRRGL